MTGRRYRPLVPVCGIAAVLDNGADNDGRGYVAVLVEQLLEDALRGGADQARKVARVSTRFSYEEAAS